MFYDITPVPKPRMTRRDKWKKRPAVLRYWAFKDEVRLKKVRIPASCEIVFFIAPPKSWPQKVREAHCDTCHTSKPDLDNLIKALLDAVLDDDAHIWKIHAAKIWSLDPGIHIEAL